MISLLQKTNFLTQKTIFQNDFLVDIIWSTPKKFSLVYPRIISEKHHRDTKWSKPYLNIEVFPRLLSIFCKHSLTLSLLGSQQKRKIVSQNRFIFARKKCFSRNFALICFAEKYGRELINYDIIKLLMLSAQSAENSTTFFVQSIIAAMVSRKQFSQNCCIIFAFFSFFHF